VAGNTAVALPGGALRKCLQHKIRKPFRSVLRVADSVTPIFVVEAGKQMFVEGAKTRMNRLSPCVTEKCHPDAAFIVNVQ
jgi:hypothetical protein